MNVRNSNLTIPRLVSTIVPVYNRAEMVREAVHSVLAQTYRPIEVILVDDGSTDDTPRVLSWMAGEYPEIVRVIRKKNGGPGLAREAGRLVARGEYIQYLDSDDWLLPRKFEVQVAALLEHPECGIAYGVSRLVDENGKVLSEPSKWTGKRFDYLFPALLVDRWWHTHTPLFLRTLCDAAGAWPKRRPEDWDLEARMGSLKARLVFCNEVLSCQRDHQGVERVTRGKHETYLRDEAWFLPRLYECAVQAGVPKHSPEMRHFSRWAFMRARHLAALGETEVASDLLFLAEQSGMPGNLSLKATKLAIKAVGWGSVARLSQLRERFGSSSD